MKDFVERMLPRPLRQLRRSLAWALADAAGRHGVPPAYYRMKVHGSLDVPSFLAVGEGCARSLLAALERTDTRPHAHAAVLDFGCGVGRTLMALRRQLPEVQLFGTDIDAAAIRWCRKHLQPATFTVNGAEPPLPYGPEAFDLIYAVSVFSHLDEELQFRWLGELQRVARPGATLLLSVHGASLAEILPPERRKEYAERGFCFSPADDWSDYFPDFYHTALHTRRYVEEHWARYFSVVDYIEKGMVDYQDLVVLRRRPERLGGGARASERPQPEAAWNEPAFSRGKGRMPAAGHIERLQWKGGESPLSVSGWLAVPDQEIVSCEVRVNGRRVGNAKRGKRRDVEAALPRLRGARESGFRLPGASVPGAADGWSYVEVVGFTRDGPAGAIATLYHPEAPAALPIPPLELRPRALNTEDAHFYRLATLRTFSALLRAIRRHAPGPGPSLRVLDWGAGCGWLTAALARLASFGEVHACDSDPDAIAWAQEALGGDAHFQVIAPHPPAPYEDGAFDVVVAPSLMARLGRETQQRWLHEVRRILRPGGLFLAAVHGAFPASVTFDPAAYANLLGKGIHDPEAPGPPAAFAPPDYYRTTHQTRRYTEAEWGKVFEILEYRERAVQNWQDLVVMQVPAAGETGTPEVAPKAVRLSSLLKADLPHRAEAGEELSAAAESIQEASGHSGQSPEQVVAAHWGMMVQDPPGIFSWTDSPTVLSHVHGTITGDPQVGWLEYACRKYLVRGGRGVERGLSLGCGNGFLEREVRARGACEVVDAYDIAPGAVEEAEKIAAREGITGIRYAVADLNKLNLPEDHYDVVFASMSVHHISNLEDLYAAVARCLKPGGVFIMLEFVGPTQFQFTDKALQIVNDLLDILPPALRERASEPGEEIKVVERSTIEHMNAVDPSEAIRSAEILPLLERCFTIVERTDYGGTLNHLLLHDIGQNFEDGSAERAALLKLLLYFEMVLVREGVLSSDFTFVVARPTTARRTTT